MTRTLLPLVAIGGGLATTPAAALELGELTVHSNLGQPLRASIAYALAPNEMLNDVCVAVNAGRSTSGMPGIGRSTISITESAILISGEAVIREPMLGTRVTINCPYTPNLSREYMLFVDPSNVAAQPRTTVAPASVRTAPVGQSARYQIQPGESLSEIVQRIENRSVKLWPAVNTIFAANPDAFVDNDPNKLKVGSWLTIPSLDGSAPIVAATAPVAATPEVASPAVEPAIGSTYETPIVEETAVTESINDLRPGDVILDSDNPFVEPMDSIIDSMVISDTELEGPKASSSSPNVPTAIATSIVSTGSRNESTSLFAWLIGGGLAVLAALVLFGRRARNRFGSTPLGPVVAPKAEPVHEDTEKVEATIDYDIDDDSPTQENLALDADLEIGTGLEDGTDMDIAQDFGFAATAQLDIELPFEPAQAVDGANETDIIAPLRPEMESILESEVLPEEDDYDMSVIMDATKMPQPEDVTKRDLMAVEVESGDDTVIEDNYTINKEVDYDILEQDYEDEMTATQALNEEIARAAAELAQDLDQTVESETQSDTSDTGAVTVNISADDKTAEMPAADNDETAEMDIESGMPGSKSA